MCHGEGGDNLRDGLSIMWNPVPEVLSGLATSPPDLLSHLAGPHFPP